jgi:hypothetical protein
LWPTLLRPGGRLFIREGHPVLWALDYDDPERTGARLPVLRPVAEPLVETEEQTYVGHRRDG